ncbi:fasciclin-like arabinogalactan protein 12 [Cannabis sativa]|uniref:fasciclin-like arabinogalactan protein 12 n=1 Tax=Cannabis sativa TaxID=3483 RepID=UPI0029CA3447|nr:fasciclin-like arabinogalactan protein 12 [Cannabis sativa]
MMKQVIILSFFIVFLFHSSSTLAQSPAHSPTQPQKPIPKAQSPTTKPVLAQPPSQAVLPAPSQAPTQKPLPHTPPRKPTTKPAPPNVTEILDKAGGFSVFVRLLKNTQVVNQIENQLNTSNSLTILAPTNGGFSSLKAGALNGLTPEQKVQLLQYHILPSYVPLQNFETLTNPVRTQASNTEDYPMNITTEGNFVNISTGIVNATLSGTVYSDNQLAIYRVDTVLLPLGIFGSKAPTPSPTPAPTPAPLAHLKPKKSSTPTSTSSSSSAALPSNSSLAPKAPKKPLNLSSTTSSSISPVAALDESGVVALTSSNGVMIGLVVTGVAAVMSILG